MKTEKIFYERLDKVFDTLRENNIKINDELFNRYTTFSRSYLDNIEEFIISINKIGYLWVKIDDEIIKASIENITFNSTYQYHEYTNDYVDVYKIKYNDSFSETISSIELLEIKRKGIIKRKRGLIGLDKDKMLIKNLNI